MVCYEGIMRLFKKTKQLPETAKAFVGGASSRFVASTVLYPVTTVRSRIQKRQYTLDEVRPNGLVHDEVFYRNMVDCFIKTWKREGFMGFYKGYAPTIIKAVPQQGIFFLLYEATLRVLSKRQS